MGLSNLKTRKPIEFLGLGNVYSFVLAFLSAVFSTFGLQLCAAAFSSMLVTGSFAVIMIVVASSMLPKCLAIIISWSVLWLATKLLVVLSAFVKVISLWAWDVSPLLLRWAARMSASVQAAMEAVASFCLGAFAIVLFPPLIILCNVLGNFTTATISSAGLLAQAPFLVVLYVFAAVVAAAEKAILVVAAVIPAVAMALMDIVAYRCCIVAEYCLEWLTAFSSPQFKVR